MSDLLSFDHILIAVRDLDAAIADYTNLGFTVYYGGKHTHKATHNGLISLADGSYIELLAPQNPNELDETIAALAEGEGYVGYALLSQDIVADAQRLAADLAIVGPTAGHRTRYDGERIEWQAVNLNESRSPFLIADVTSHSLRVPTTPDKANHANGAIGTAEVVLAVPDLVTATARYTKILGVTPSGQTHSSSEQRVSFALESQTITLAQPLVANSPLADHLARSGEVPYLLRLRTDRPEMVGMLALAESHGARLELVENGSIGRAAK